MPDKDPGFLKIVGFPPQIIHFNTVFPLFSPSIFGVFPLFLETPIYPITDPWDERYYSPTWMVDFYGFHVGTVNIPYMDIMDPMGMSLERDYIPPYSYDLGMGCFRPSILF